MLPFFRRNLCSGHDVGCSSSIRGGGGGSSSISSGKFIRTSVAEDIFGSDV
jgi:hypothetical protein